MKKTLLQKKCENGMSPEELNRLLTAPPPFKEYRLYYDTDGTIVTFVENNHPPGDNYIVLDDPDQFYKANILLLKVKNGKLIKVDPVINYRAGVKLSTEGQPVVKGIAAIALLPNETYTEIEYYERKTNN